jgi:hypothetical protein
MKATRPTGPAVLCGVLALTSSVLAQRAPSSAPAGPTQLNPESLLSRIQALEQRAAQSDHKIADLERQLSSFQASYARHVHRYTAPRVDALYNFSTFKREMERNAEPLLVPLVDGRMHSPAQGTPTSPPETPPTS